MKRPKTIGLVGTSGAGKTTLAKELAKRMGTIFIEIDAIRHKENWQRATDSEFQEGIEKQIGNNESWVIDGVVGDPMGERLDLILWLDLPLHVKLNRAIKRSLKRIVTKEEIWNGNRESWYGAFLAPDGVVPFMFRAHFRHRRNMPKSTHFYKVKRLKTAAEVDDWLSNNFPESKAIEN